jgi:hypothetical protein
MTYFNRADMERAGIIIRGRLTDASEGFRPALEAIADALIRGHLLKGPELDPPAAPEPDADTLELIEDCRKTHAIAANETRPRGEADNRFSREVARLLDFSNTADAPRWNNAKAAAFKAGMDAEGDFDRTGRGALSNPHAPGTPLYTCWRAGYYWHVHIMADCRTSRQEMNLSTGGL